jgi:hypothetical protein
LEWNTCSENIKHAYKNGLKEYKFEHKKGKDNPCSRKVYQMDMQGNIIKKWDCMNDAFREKGYYVGFISLCCRGKYKTAYGYVWKYVEE